MIPGQISPTSSCRRFTLYAVMLAVLPAVAAVQPAHASANTALSTSAVRLIDLPSGMRQTFRHTYSTGEAARLDHVSPAVFTREGRLSSYKVVFLRSSRVDIFDVENVLAAYRTPAGAHWDFARVVNAAVQRNARLRTVAFKTLPVQSVGDERQGMLLAGRVLTVAVVRFHRGKFRVTVKVTSTTAHVRAGQTLALAQQLAHTVDQRIKKLH